MCSVPFLQFSISWLKLARYSHIWNWQLYLAGEYLEPCKYISCRVSCWFCVRAALFMQWTLQSFWLLHYCLKTLRGGGLNSTGTTPKISGAKSASYSTHAVSSYIVDMEQVFRDYKFTNFHFTIPTHVEWVPASK